MTRELTEVQAGFRKGRETSDQIANILWIVEKAREFQKNTSISALLTAKASDYISSIQFNRSVMSDSLRPHES